MSLIVPCFNHGRYLTACLDAIREQTYPELEVIVVDDASTDPQTLSLIDELDRHADDVSVIRMPRNSGPSAARNAAIEQSTGRYLLPVDADNVLLPDAVSRLVEQLQSSGEHVGFIYPNLQYFGNRNDYFEAPDYNLHLLLQSNYADTSSLLDREIFDAGVRYPEEIVLGHEDWDFALSLAEHEVYGEPALAKTLLYRKTGFTRSDLVEYGSAQFHETVVRRHPSLFKREVDVKAHWSPALSVLPLEPLTREDERERLMKLSAFQSLKDFEVLARVAEPWPHHVAAPAMRRLPPELAASVAGALEVGLQTARGSHVLVTAGNGLDLLEDPSFVAKLMSTLHYNLGLGGVALTDAGSDGRFPLRLLRPKEGVDARPHALLWRAYRDDAVASPLSVREGDELGSLTAAIAARMPVQWRHAPGPRGMASGGIGRIRDVRRRTTQRGSETCERERRFRTPPALPGVEGGALRRWTLSPTWMPPETELICRHVSADGTRRVTTNDRVSPPGYILEYDIGMVRKFSAPGTLRLVRLDDGGYDAIDPDQDVEESRSIGFVEQAAFPLLDPLVLGVHRKTGTQALVSGPEDPLIHDVEPIRTLGFIESYPVNPRHRPNVELPFRVRGVVRGVDRERRRHVYAVGGLPDGEVVGEIGALDTEPSAGSTPVWLTPSGYLITDTYQPDTPRFQAAAVARWLAAPLTWGGRVAPTAARVRSSAKRALDLPSAAVDRRGERGADRQVEPVGYLASEPALHRLPLYSAVHPVTGDQLLTPWRLEADDMGYVQTTLLGYARGLAPVTGNAPFNRVTVPWASRFGQNARTS